MDGESGKESGRESAGSGSVDEEVRQEPLRKDTPGPMPQYQYSREILQEIQESAGAKKRPLCLSPLYDNSEGIWDPEKWCKSMNPEGSEGSPTNSMETHERKRPLELDLLRRKVTVDSLERLKEEQDGIVLSPQRRSFGTGCHVTQTSNLVRQSSTTSDYTDDRDRGGDRRERRIGSGRIQIDRDQVRDYRGRYDRDDRDRVEERHDERGDRRFERNDRFRREYDDRRDFRDSRDRDNRGDRIERGDRDRDPRNLRNRDNQHRDYNGRDGHRYSSGRRNHHQEEEPEWFTAGPTSREDTIELQGFEKENNSREKDTKSAEPKRRRERKSPSVEKQQETERERGTNFGDRNGSLETNESSSPEAAETRPSPTTASLFDFDQFFHGGIPGFQDEIKNVEGDSGSRFSRWFGQGRRSRDNSRRSSINDELHFEYLNDMLESKSPVLIPSPTPPPIPNVFDKSPFYPNFPNVDDKTPTLETVLHHKNMVSLNPNINHMFMANTGTPNSEKSNASISNNPGIFSPQDAEAHLKAMLFGRRKDSGSSSGTASPGGGKLKTVAELEAGFHQNSPNSSARMSPILQHHHQHQQHQHQQHQQQQQQQHQQHHQQQQQQQHNNNKQDEGDLTAFNKLLSLMAAGANSGSPSPPNSQMMQQPETRQMSPLTDSTCLPSIAGNMSSSQQQLNNSKFMEAVMRNREQQMHLQQHAMNQMRLSQPPPPPPQQTSPLPMPQHMVPQQQQITGPRPITRERMMTNFIQQNPTIITKPPSPAVGQIPNIVHSTSTPRLGPSPSPLMTHNLLQKQQATVPRIPSPIMFSQQPPMHLNAPSPIHPSQLGRAMPNNTLSTSPTMLNRVPSPQELIAHNQAILQSALIKKQLEDQKERFLKKQQDRAKSPGLNQSQNRPVSVSGMMNSMNVTQPSPANKTTMSPAFTPTSVMRKMHSDKASEKEKGKPEGEDNMNKPPIKQIVPDGHGDQSDIKMDIDSNGQIDHFLAQDINKILISGQGHSNKGLRAVMGNAQNQTPVTSQIAGSGRPIYKSTAYNGPQQSAMTQMTTSTPQAQQPRPLTGITQTPPTGHRPITGGIGNPNIDINKILQQQHQQQQVRPNASTPIPRPGLSSNPQFGIPITGRMPMQSNILQGQMHPTSANALIVQQMIQNTTSQAARVNAMNQLNQLNPLINNQLAAIHAQQRLMDPRLQGIRGMYPPPGPPLLSPRSNATTNVNMVSPTNTGFNHPISPAKFLPFSQKQDGPILGNLLHQNNSPDSNIFNKLFGNTVINSQLPSMPPLPVQGQRVMTVDEIERH